MANPFTLAAGSAALTAGGGLLKAYGESEAGEATGKMYAYKAGLARRNATIQRQNADYALEAGDINAARSGLTTGFTIARQRVGQAANGFDVNTGTNAAVQDSTRDIGVVDQNTIRTNAGRQSLSFRNQATGLEAEATMDEMAGDNARRAGKISALSTLIGTAGSVAGKWYQGNEVFGSANSGITLYGPDQTATGFIRTR